MEQANAPEKIFLEWYRIGDKKYRDWCITPKTNNEPVEYTRTDAFIDNACEWIRNNYHKYADNALGKEYLLGMEYLTNDFKNYMKGK